MEWHGLTKHVRDLIRGGELKLAHTEYRLRRSKLKKDSEMVKPFASIVRGDSGTVRLLRVLLLRNVVDLTRELEQLLQSLALANRPGQFEQHFARFWHPPKQFAVRGQSSTSCHVPWREHYIRCCDKIRTELSLISRIGILWKLFHELRAATVSDDVNGVRLENRRPQCVITNSFDDFFGRAVSRVITAEVSPDGVP